MQKRLTEEDLRSLLDGKIYKKFDGEMGSSPLADLCLTLLAEQKQTWPMLSRGYASIDHAAQRRLACDGFSALVQHNPGRIKSTLAAVGEKDINKRPCFLCLPQLPREQRAVLYRNDYLILCNPMPVFPAHFTIAAIDHRPQSISGHIAILIQLMADFGCGWTILYNGPKCGASAPDHFHFQAIQSGQLPVEQEVLHEGRLTLVDQHGEAVRFRANAMGRETVVIEGSSPAAVGESFMSFHDVLNEATGGVDEPMMNMIGLYTETMGQRPRAEKNCDSQRAVLCTVAVRPSWRLLIFPRRKHRPDAFFKKGNERIAVSPAAVEMGGVFVTPFAGDFERLDAASIRSIYKEVSFYSTSS